MTAPAWLDAIEARVKAATPGPWTPYQFYDSGRKTSVEAPDGSLPASDIMRPENLDFIAHARLDIPALLACVRVLGEALETIAIREHPDHFGSRRVAKTALTLYRTGPTPPAEEETR
jgi:hypothetical protein